MPSINSRNPVSTEPFSAQSPSESPLPKPGREPRAIQLDRPLPEDRMDEDVVKVGDSEWMQNKIPG